jgi:hypothetical protein
MSQNSEGANQRWVLMFLQWILAKDIVNAELNLGKGIPRDS